MNISLTPDLDQLVADKGNSGRYTSASEVVREALRLLESRDLQLHTFNDEIVRRIEELGRGERLSAEQLNRKMKAFTDDRRKARG